MDPVTRLNTIPDDRRAIQPRSSEGKTGRRPRGSRRILANIGVRLVLVAGVALAAPAQSQELRTVAVMDFGGFMMTAGGVVNIGAAVSAMLVTEFADREGIRVIERAELHAMLDEMDLTFSGRVTESTAIRAGELVGAQYLFFGSVVSIIDTYLRMDIRAVDVETSVVVAVLKKDGAVSELFAILVSLADEFGQKLDLAPPSGRPAVGPIPVAATIAFSRAVNFEDRGEVDSAIEFYETTLEMHPAHRGAQRALERLRGN